MKVLVADDEATSRILLEDALQEWGCEVVPAADGLEAWNLLQKKDAPQLVILDWMMPGMDGTDLCRKLRESANANYVYIILLTSKGEKKDIILGMDAGADAFLTKPVDFAELKSRITAGKRILSHQRQIIDAESSKATIIKMRGEDRDSTVESVKQTIAEKFLQTAEDLTLDSNLALAPRKLFGDRVVPSLGRVLVLNKIGEGGMGAVYRGYNPRLQLEVAIKILSARLFRDRTDAAARFYREAQIATMVKSDNLVRCFDVDQENGLMYLTMELIEGKTAVKCIEDAVDKKGGLSEYEALDLCIAATRGLAAAHANGIIHRDVKPENILIPRNEARTGLDFSAAKLADLGIARQEVGQNDLTMTNEALGTAGFMAPEQIRNAKSAGKPADVFSMGATLYVMLAGRPPFLGASTFDVFNNTIFSPHTPLAKWRQGISATTTAIIDACLNKNPAERYKDAGMLLEDLIYCRKLLETTSNNPSKTSVTLPRVQHESFHDAVI
jgi:DNA-binding response OmpR family regulator/tRNA A-37 threonylcarbamoyl transferase component Bud32